MVPEVDASTSVTVGWRECWTDGLAVEEEEVAAVFDRTLPICGRRVAIWR